MSFLIRLSLTAKLMPVSTECAAALLSFRYPSYILIIKSTSKAAIGREKLLIL